MLELTHISKSFGERKVLRDVNIHLESGKVYALVGTNGSGKTTLFNIMSGFLRADGGNIFFDRNSLAGLAPHKINGLGIGRTFQDLRLVQDLTVLENLMLAFTNQEGEKWWKAVLPKGVYGEQQLTLVENATEILGQTFLSDVLDSKAGEISYGQQKLLTLACCMANNPDVLLLDEPVAGINPSYRDKMVPLIKGLKEEGKFVLLIEHHAEFIEEVADQVFFLNNGVVKVFDNYERLRNDPEVQHAYV